LERGGGHTALEGLAELLKLLGRRLEALLQRGRIDLDPRGQVLNTYAFYNYFFIALVARCRVWARCMSTRSTACHPCAR
jgi:hypothetical protein